MQTEAKEERKQQEPATKKEEAKKDNKKKTEEASSSSESDEGEPETLSKADLDKIKKLIADQDKEIETLKEQVKNYKDKLIYQLAENDNTIKRYKKEVDQTREFAITKFAKDLLDVKDSLERASDFIKKVKIDEETDVNEIKKHFHEIVNGMGMTAHVMDNCLKRFGVVQFSPMGEKFDPNVHEAIFTIPDGEQPNNHIGSVMQSGWKIGDRVLRAAKVGIVKKSK